MASSTDVSAYQDEMWGVLFASSQSEDNKAICAECIGRLAIIDPKVYIPKLQVCWALFSTGTFILTIVGTYQTPIAYHPSGSCPGYQIHPSRQRRIF